MASVPGDLAVDENEFGRVAVFERTRDGWQRTATPVGNAESGGGSGFAIDAEGDNAMIAAPKAIYLYEKRGRNWIKTAKALLRGDDSAFGSTAITGP
jgi:hypothetical protein